MRRQHNTYFLHFRFTPSTQRPVSSVRLQWYRQQVLSIESKIKVPRRVSVGKAKDRREGNGQEHVWFCCDDDRQCFPPLPLMQLRDAGERSWVRRHRGHGLGGLPHQSVPCQAHQQEARCDMACSRVAAAVPHACCFWSQERMHHCCTLGASACCCRDVM